MQYHRVDGMSRSTTVNVHSDTGPLVELAESCFSRILGQLGFEPLASLEEAPQMPREARCWRLNNLLVSHSVTTPNNGEILCATEVYSAERYQIIDMLKLRKELRDGIDRAHGASVGEINRSDREAADKEKKAQERERDILRKKEAEERLQGYISFVERTLLGSNPTLVLVDAINNDTCQGCFYNDMEMAALPAESYGVVVWERMRVRGGWKIIFQRQVGFLFSKVEGVAITNEVGSKTGQLFTEMTIYFKEPILVEGFSREVISHAENPLKPTTYDVKLRFSNVSYAAQAYSSLNRCKEMAGSSFAGGAQADETLRRVSDQVRQTLQGSMKPDNEIRW